jgi:hypothetical protein
MPQQRHFFLRTMAASKMYYKAAKECVDPKTGAVQLRPAMNSSRHVFVVGSTHVLEGEPELCWHGFHASPHPATILLQPRFGYNVHDALLKVSLGSEAAIVHDDDADDGKVVSCYMKVLARMSWAEAIAEAGMWRGRSYALEGDTVAITWPNGDLEWRRHGVLHRDGDLPALVEMKEGHWWSQHYYVDGRRHRANAPAVIYRDGRRQWYDNGAIVGPACH